jgi:hypothetical protein
MTNVGAWCVAVLLALAAPAWAGATLRGVVVRDREHGAPMAGVELTAPGANPLTPDGRHVVSASGDQTLKVWELGSASRGRSRHGRCGASPARSHALER